MRRRTCIAPRLYIACAPRRITRSILKLRTVPIGIVLNLRTTTLQRVIKKRVIRENNKEEEKVPRADEEAHLHRVDRHPLYQPALCLNLRTTTLQKCAAVPRRVGCGVWGVGCRVKENETRSQ